MALVKAIIKDTNQEVILMESELMSKITKHGVTTGNKTLLWFPSKEIKIISIDGVKVDCGK